MKIVEVLGKIWDFVFAILKGAGVDVSNFVNPFTQA